MIVDLERKDGTVLTGALQGNGGQIHDRGRVRQFMRGLQQELADLAALPEEKRGQDRGTVSRGTWVLQKHAGNVSVWTDPDNPIPSLRLTTSKMTDVKAIRLAGTTDEIWPGPKLVPCGAWAACAYYAHVEWQSPDGTQRMPICSNCSRLYKLDGWTVVKEDRDVQP